MPPVSSSRRTVQTESLFFVGILCASYRGAHARVRSSGGLVDFFLDRCRDLCHSVYRGVLFGFKRFLDGSRNRVDPYNVQAHDNDRSNGKNNHHEFPHKVAFVPDNPTFFPVQRKRIIAIEAIGAEIVLLTFYQVATIYSSLKIS
jgi:hypothetical protein